MRVDLLKHNQEAYEKVQEAIKEGEKKIAISHATGTGKSYLVTKLFEDFNNDKKLVLVPSTYISDQIQALFEKYNIQNVDVMRYQKLIKMSDEDIADMDYDVIALDEYHHDTSKVWGNKVKTLIESHSESIIFGTSATPVRSDGVNTIDELFEGNCASALPLSESIAKKIVPLPKYVGALYTLDDELEKLRQKVENATNTSEEKQEFYKKIDLMRSQIEKSYGMPIILNKHIKNKEGKYLVFCKNKRHLREVKETVIGWFRTAGCKDINAYEVYSDYENKDAEYKAFCEDTSHNLKLLFCVNMLNEGLHLENISGVLLLRPTRSSIVWHQQIGRAIEANNTNTPVIIDAVNNFSAVGQGMELMREIKDAIAKEKESDSDFDDSGFEDIDTFFVLEQVVEIQEMFKEIEGRLKGREWTEDEIEILKKWYPIEGYKVESRLSGRTKQAVITQAYKLGLKAPDDLWTEKENNILKEYYPIEGSKVIDRLKGRTGKAAEAQARKLGLKAPDNSWREKEIEILKKYFSIEGIKVMERLNGRTEGAIWKQAYKLGLKAPDDLWTDEENRILMKYYPIEGSKVIDRLTKRRSKGAINLQASKLGLKIHNCKPWTEEEIEILKKYYIVEGTKVRDRLDGRTKSAIQIQIIKLGIKKFDKWTEDENDILRKYYPIEGTGMVNRLKGRTKNAVKTQARKLGLKYRIINSEYKYVTKQKNKYVVQMYIDGKNMRFGTFDSEDEAGRVAMEKAKEYGKAI